MAFTPFKKTDLPTMDNFNKKFQEAISYTEDKVGDVKITTRTDLGDDWLLCNGELSDPSQYPELLNMLPRTVNTQFGETSDVLDVNFGALSKLEICVENDMIIYISQQSGSPYKKYVVYKPVSGGKWSISALPNTDILSTSMRGEELRCSWIKDAWYFIYGVTIDKSTSSITVVKTVDFIDFNFINIPASISSLEYSCELSDIRYNEITQEYCAYISPLGTKTVNHILYVGSSLETLFSNSNMKKISLSYSSMLGCLQVVNGKFIIYAMPDSTSGSSKKSASICIYQDGTFSVYPLLSSFSTYYNDWGFSRIFIISNTYVVIYMGNIFYGDSLETITTKAEGTTYNFNNSSAYATAFYSAVNIEEENSDFGYFVNIDPFYEKIYLTKYHKSPFEIIEPTTENITVRDNSMPINTNTGVAVYNFSDNTFTKFSPMFSSRLPSISVDKAYAYIKGR